MSLLAILPRTRAARSAASSPAALRLLAVIALLPASPLVAQTTFNWTGNVDFNWNVDGNWNIEGTPSTPDSVVIGGNTNVGLNGGTSVANVTLSGDTITSGSSNLIIGTGGNLTIGSDAQPASLIVGQAGTAALTVSGGGVLTLAGLGENSSVIGAQAGSVATATVETGGSIWTTGDIAIGVFGQGTLNIKDGGVVNSLKVDLATSTAGGPGTTVGTVLVTGSGSQWNVSGAFNIGGYVDEDHYNSGTLTIADGATVTVGEFGGGTLAIHNNGTLTIGDGAAAGTLAAGEVSLIDTAPADDAPSATSPTLRFNHTGSITFSPTITGDGVVVKNGSGTTTLSANSTYSGATIVNNGTLVIETNAEWQGSSNFQVNGGNSTLRIASGTTVGADLAVVTGTVEVAGVLENNPGESTFDDGATLRVLPSGVVADGYFTFTGQSSLIVDEGGSIADGDFYFDEEATFTATGLGAVTGGIFAFGGDRAVTLPAAGVVTAGAIELHDKVSTDLNQTGMILSVRDESDPSLDTEVSLDLFGTSHATISAAGAIDSSYVTLWDDSSVSITAAGGVDNSLLDIGDQAVVTLSADNALSESGVYLSGDGALVLNGHDATLVDFLANGGRVVNNSPDAATLTFELCGCYPAIAAGDIFADSDASHVGAAGPLSLVINGSDPDTTAAVFFGVQRHTGSTTVNSATLVVYGGDYDHDGLPETDPIPAGFLSSPIVLNMGSILTGTGPVNTVTVNDSGIAPGDGVGALVTGPVALSGDTFLRIDLADFSGGSGVGWDLLQVEGGFDFSSTLGDTFTVYLSSMNLDPDATDSLAANFNPLQDYSLAILVASGGITGFSVGSTAVDATGIVNAHGGSWCLRLSGDATTIYLDYTAPIPEPASAAAFSALLAAFSLGGRRRRRRS